MRTPMVEIDIGKIRENTEHIVSMCKKHKIEVMGITKGVCASEPVVEAMLTGGVKKLGDARMENIISMRKAGIKAPMYLIRIPMLSEVEDVIKYADGSLNSELEVIKALSDKARVQGKKHKVILMVDVGDLREGVLPIETIEVTSKILELSNIEFEGIGTNVGCYGGILPSFENTKILIDLAREIEKKFDIKIKTISGGTTGSLGFLKKGVLAPGINQFRVGEGILLGTNAIDSSPIPGTHQDTMKVKAEVIEVKTKPSYPIGEIVTDAFGNVPVLEDKGNRRRAIVALGNQDCKPNELICVDNSIEILGASSDHLILDVTECSYDIKVGSIIEFYLSYGGMLNIMTSKYVKKLYKKQRIAPLSVKK